MVWSKNRPSARKYLPFDPLLNIKSLKKQIQIVIKKWGEIHQDSIKSVNSVLGILGKLVLAQNQKLYEGLENYPELSERLVYRLLTLINERLPLIEKSVRDFEKVYLELESVVTAYKRSVNSFIKKIENDKSDYTKRQIEIASQTLAYLEDIQNMYETEFYLKKEILSLLPKVGNDPAKLSLYFTIWIAEPYIDLGRIEEILEALLGYERELAQIVFPQEEITAQQQNNAKLPRFF